MPRPYRPIIACLERLAIKARVCVAPGHRSLTFKRLMAEEKSSTKRRLALTALVAGALVFMLWLAGLLEFGKIPPSTVAREAPPTPGRVFAVQEVEIPQELPVLAQVISKTLTQVSARVPGQVHEIWVEAGDRVKAGDPLVLLHGPEYHDRVSQAKAGAAQAQAHLTQIKADYERYRRLLKEGAVSPREFEAMDAKLRSAQAALDQSQAQVREALTFQDYTVLKAPLNGLVAARPAAVGDLAQPGQSLVSLYDPRRMRIEGEVNDEYRGHVTLGMPVRFEIPALRYQGESTIAEIFPISAPGSRTFTVRTAVLQSYQAVPKAVGAGRKPSLQAGLRSKQALVPGLFARLYVQIGKTRGLLIPQAAVREIGQLTMVDVLAEGRPTRRQVKLGRQIGEQVEVLAGLQTGERIILP